MLRVKLTSPTCMVPLIYNFTSTHVYTCGATQYFTWKIIFFPVQIYDKTWALDLAKWNSLHDARLSHGSMPYNPQE